MNKREVENEDFVSGNEGYFGDRSVDLLLHMKMTQFEIVLGLGLFLTCVEQSEVFGKIVFPCK